MVPMKRTGISSRVKKGINQGLKGHKLDLEREKEKKKEEKEGGEKRRKERRGKVRNRKGRK